LAIARFPILAHQTGRADFRHPAFRLASPQGTRRGRSGQALKAQNAEFSINDIECESAIAAPLHLVPSREEPAHAFNDVLVDATVCLARAANAVAFQYACRSRFCRRSVSRRAPCGRCCRRRSSDQAGNFRARRHFGFVPTEVACSQSVYAFMASMLAEERKDSLIVSVRVFGRHGV
jgi:hypothetical protein